MSSAAELLFSQPPLAGAPALVFGDVDALPVAPVVPSDPRALVFQTLVADVADIRALVFGAETADVAPPVGIATVTLQGSGQISGLRGYITLRTVAVVQAAGQLSGLRGHLSIRTVAVLGGAGRISGLRGFITATYDNRVTRWLGQPVAAAQQKAAPAFVEMGSAWRVSLPRRAALALPWQTAHKSSAALAIPFASAVPRRQSLAAPWQLALQRHRQAAAMHQKAVLHDIQRSAGWQQADRRAIESAIRLQTGLWRDMRRAGGWMTAIPQVRDLSAPGGASLHLVGVQFMAAPWGTAVRPRNGRSVPPVAPAPTPCYVPNPSLLFDTPWSSSAALVFTCERQAAGPRARVVIPFLRAYVTVNSIILRRVSDGAPIPAFGFNMALDWQSWTWSWSTSIPINALALVKPGISGDPIEVEAVVNGAPYRLCVEGLDRQRQLVKGRVGIKGRGTAAILDAPYAPVLNFGNAEARTAQQLMLDALTINGVGIGWDVDFGLTDWPVPGNAWAHQGVYISALLDIVGAAGGYVQPHDTAQTLRILPKYPVGPWDWGDVVPDFELPGIATVEGVTWQRKTAYNRIHVSGIGAGVLGQVTRAGTAGDSVAPMVTHALITHVDAARQRGLAELSDTGMQADVSLKLPVLPETGLILPGKFVRYRNDSETHIGLVRNIVLDWSMPRLRQTLSVETHV